MARTGIDRGQIPYRDFEYEYPPLAWWLMATPRLLDSQSHPDEKLPAEEAQRFLASYFGWFHFLLYLADVVCLVLIYLIARRTSRLAEWAIPMAYVLATCAQPHVLYDRLDVGLSMFFLLWAYFWQRSLEPSPAAGRWALASYFSLGLGFSFKLIPIICLPLILLADVRVSRSRRQIATLVLSFAVAGLGPFLIQAMSAGWSILDPFQYHGEREIHVELIWASMMLVARVFGVPAKIAFAHGGSNLMGPWHMALKGVAGLSIVASAALLGLWALGAEDVSTAARRSTPPTWPSSTAWSSPMSFRHNT